MPVGASRITFASWMPRIWSGTAPTFINISVISFVGAIHLIDCGVTRENNMTRLFQLGIFDGLLTIIWRKVRIIHAVVIPCRIGGGADICRVIIAIRKSSFGTPSDGLVAVYHFRGFTIVRPVTTGAIMLVQRQQIRQPRAGIAAKRGIIALDRRIETIIVAHVHPLQLTNLT